MASDIDDLLKMIEDVRNKLEEMIDNRGLDDHQVIAASRILDAVLVEYYKLLKKDNLIYPNT